MGMFADKRAFRKGDQLTVLIEETTTMSASQRTKSDKASSIDDKINRLIYPNWGRHNGALPELSVDGESSYDGGGEIANSQKVTTRVTIPVIDVRPNGSLVVGGVRKISFSGETHFVFVTGFARSEDITPENTVLSTKLADANIEMVSEGELTETQRKGWLLRINGLVSPF